MERTGPSAPSIRAADRGWGDRRRAVRRTTRAAAERPRHLVGRVARGDAALRWGGPGGRGSAG